MILIIRIYVIIIIIIITIIIIIIIITTGIALAQPLDKSSQQGIIVLTVVVS